MTTPVLRLNQRIFGEITGSYLSNISLLFVRKIGSGQRLCRTKEEQTNFCRLFDLTSSFYEYKKNIFYINTEDIAQKNTLSLETRWLYKRKTLKKEQVSCVKLSYIRIRKY